MENQEDLKHPFMTTTSLAAGHPVPPDGTYRWLGCSAPYQDYPAFGDNMLRISHFWQATTAESKCAGCGHTHEDHLDEDGFKGPMEVGCSECSCDGYKP